MKICLVIGVLVAVGCKGDIIGTSRYVDWLKYDSQVNDWGDYKNYDTIGDGWKDTVTYQNQYWGKNNEYNNYGRINKGKYNVRQKYDGDSKDYLYSYKEQGRRKNQDYGFDYNDQKDTKYYGEYNEAYNNGNDYSDRDIYDSNRYRTYKERNWDENDEYDDVNLVGLGKNDREDLIRPCAFEDWECIRKYFAKNSQCTPKHGPAPDPLYLKRNTIYYPRFNITQVLPGLRVTGLGSIKISEFYVNKDTGNLVIALDFKNLNETVQQAYYRYKRTAKESIVLKDYTTIEFSSGTFTAVIPKIPHLRLDLAEIHADIDDATPKIIIGPEAAYSKDPDVIEAFAEFVSNLPSAIKEAFLFQSQLFTAIYIQENICDFGLKLISI